MSENSVLYPTGGEHLSFPFCVKNYSTLISVALVPLAMQLERQTYDKKKICIKCSAFNRCILSFLSVFKISHFRPVI